VDDRVNALTAAIAGLAHRPANVVSQNTVSEDGKYQVQVNLWHATQNKASMGNGSLNHTALIEVIDGVWYMSVSVHPMQVGTITASLASLQIRQANGGYANADIIARNIAGNKPGAFRFALPSRDTYIAVKVDPQVAVMGDEPVDARLRIGWDTLTKVSDDVKLTSNTAVSVGNADTVLSDAQSFTDAATGITIETGANILPEGARFDIKPIASGADYTRAQKALEDIGTNFRLFDISLFNANDVKIQPNGAVKVSLPIPSGMDGERIEVYRINDDDTRTLMESTAEGDVVVFYTNHFSLYAVVERAADDEAAVSGNTSAGGDKSITAADTPLGAGETGGFNLLWLLIPIVVIAAVAVILIVRRRAAAQNG
jgi:hypothetical protein